MRSMGSAGVRSFLTLCCLFVATALSGQSVAFLDAQGLPFTAPYLEGSRAYLRVVDPGASGTVALSVSAVRSGDFEPVLLGETGLGTGVFEGWISLSIGAPAADGLLQTSRDASQYPWTFDDLVATYGGSSAGAATVGSTVVTLDGGGATVASFRVGELIYVRVADALRDSTPGNDTAVVTLSTTVGSWSEYEDLVLTESGGDTGIFVGAIQTAPGDQPVQNDGTLVVRPGAAVWVQHDDANGETYSALQLSILPNEPLTLSFVDAPGQPAGTFQEFGPVELRATDSDLAGQWWGVTVRTSSDLRGDEEFVELHEEPFFSGIFRGVVTLGGRLAGAPTANDGLLEVTEIAGTSVQRDTIRAELLDCSAPPCPTATASMTGSSLRISDALGADLDSIVPPRSITFEARDRSVPFDAPVTATISSQGDSETLNLVPAWQDPVAPQLGRFRGSLQVEIGSAVPGDGRLQVLAEDVVLASRPDPLGLTVATDQAVVAAGGENQPPVATGDFAITDEDTVLTISLLGNDLDPEGQPITLDALFPPSRGTATIVDPAAGTVLYTPDPNANGLDSFVYRIRDSEGATGLGYVDVTIRSVNDPPVASNDAVTTAEDTLVSVYPLANDADPEGDTLWISSVQQGAHGQVGATATMFNYLPAANYNGTETLTYTMNDGNGGTSSATVTITITPVPDPPVAVVDNVTFAEDTVATISPLLNDLDPDGDSIVLLSVTTAFHGTLALTGIGTVTYTPVANYSGTDRFDYTIQDSTGRTATARVNLTLTPVNDPPDAVNDSVSVNEDGSTTVFVKSNDTDPDGDLTFIQSVTQGAHGAVVLSGGLPVYTPTPNYFGPDAFTYTLSDGKGGTDAATVSVTVNPVPDGPIGVADAASTPEDTSVVVNVLANDSDADGNTLTVFGVTQPAHGSANFTSSSVRYVPSANYSGPDTFTYSINDGTGRSYLGITVSITVTPVNDPPIAGNDAASVAEDGSVGVPVLANDSDLDGDTLVVTAVTQGAHGTVSFAGGSVTYVPSANYSGGDSFAYTIGDGNGGSGTATVSVTVTAVNDSPNGGDDFASVAEDGSTSVSVLANDSDADGDTLVVTAVTQGVHGTVSFTGASVTYIPSANYNGGDTFTYTIVDGNGGSATATVSVTVTAVNDSPNGGDDFVSVAEDGSASVSVLGNDSDPDGDTLVVTAVTQSAHGTVSFAGGLVTYIPSANYNGSDSFTYTISDGNGGASTATVSIMVTAANDAPLAGNDVASVVEDGSVNVAVLANDSDLEGDSLTMTAVSQPAHGTVSFAGGSVTYVPSANYNGSDSFTYTISDGQGGAANGTVSVTVSSVNDPPDAVNDSATLNEASGGIALAVLANDSDLDGALTVVSVSTPAHGTATRNADNTITYVPVASYSGPDVFTYTVSDRFVTDTATVAIQVKDVIGRVALLATHSVWMQIGSDLLSGDIVANEVGAAPFLNVTEVSIAGSATTAAGWDVIGNRVTIAAGATVASDVYSNQLFNTGTVNGSLYSPPALPVFVPLPSFQASSPGTTDVSVATNGTRTLAPGSYRDLIVGKRGTVTFTGGIYHFRNITLSGSEAKLYFSAASEVRVQNKISTNSLAVIKPATGAPITASSIVFYVGGINGTAGGLTEAPKAVEIGIDSLFSANLYVPNGSIWLKDRTLATGAFVGKDVRVGPDVQVTLNSAW